MSNDALGMWYCELVDQEQSEDEADAYGDYDDMGFSREQKASKTEFAGATLELFEDGRYELKAQDYNSSHGTWEEDGGSVALRQADDCINGYEGLEYSHGGGDRFTVSFKLNADSHDGLDILVLTFGREPPKQKGPKPDNFVDQLLAVEDEDELYEVLDEAFGNPDDDGDDDGDDDDDDGPRAPKTERRPPEALCAELWDAWLEGRIAADPEAEDHWLQTQAFSDERVTEGGGFSHRHARHALETLDYDDHREMFGVVEDKLAHLPEDPAADAELAPLLATAQDGKWLARLVESRFLGGGHPEAFYARPLLPQPETAEASRAYLSKTGYYTRFEAIEGLYPPGHPDLAKIALRYRGRGLLDVPLELIERRGIRAEAKAAALAWLEDPKTNKGTTTGLSAMMFALVFAVEDGESLPDSVVEALGTEIKGMVMGSPTDEEKAKLRAIAAKLPEEQRARVHARFWLDPKT